MNRDEQLRLASDWADADPDCETSSALRAIIESGDDAALEGCFVPSMEFGTAGLRGVVGPGPARMNLAVVRRVSRALADVVVRRHASDGSATRGASVVLGFDGRIDSRRFAREAVATLAATPVSVAFFEQPVPTPVVAYAAQRLGADCGIVVTASHNPPEYNGYKVYGADAIQIVAPFDSEVTQRLAEVGPARLVPADFEAVDVRSDRVIRLDESTARGYVEAVVAGRAPGAVAAPIRVAYTPLHGVGASWVETVLQAAGYSDLHIEPSQRGIDGTFPTVRFPNPEEPATLAKGIALAQDLDADVLLVNDPDADRMGAAIPGRDGQFRILSGNEIGIILTDYLLSRCVRPDRAALATTIVSTPMTQRVGEHYGAHVETTLTGFKWLWTAMRSLEQRDHFRFALCWEEALGYSTHPAVRDKDGIAAALVFADWVSECRAQGIAPIERLSNLYRQYGAWGSAQRNVVRGASTGAAEIALMMRALECDPPRELAGLRVTKVVDHRQVDPEQPLWRGAAPMFIVELEAGARIVVRPSGTEPKLKCYADLELPIAGDEDPLDTNARARAAAEALNQALVERLEMVLSA